MNRAERRRIAKSKEKKAVYTYTEEQLKVLVDSLVKMKVEQEKRCNSTRDIGTDFGSAFCFAHGSADGFLLD